MQHEIERLQRQLRELQAMMLALSARPSVTEDRVRALIREQLRGVEIQIDSVGDIPYKRTPAVQLGDPVGVSADDTVTRADSKTPLLAVGFCVDVTSTGCLVRRVGLVPRAGTIAGAIYYLGSSPGSSTTQDPKDDPSARIFQRLAVGKNGSTLDACVTLQFVTLR